MYPCNAFLVDIYTAALGDEIALNDIVNISKAPFLQRVAATCPKLEFGFVLFSAGKVNIKVRIHFLGISTDDDTMKGKLVTADSKKA